MEVTEAVGRQDHDDRRAVAQQLAPGAARWVAHQVPQCGFCQSGVIMAAAGAMRAGRDGRRGRERDREHLHLRHLPAHARSAEQHLRRAADHDNVNGEERARRPQISRRHFLVAGAGGLTLGVVIPSLPGVRGALAGAGRRRGDREPRPAASNVNAYVHIGTDNKVTLMYGGSEFGQGSKTGSRADPRRGAARPVEGDHRPAVDWPTRTSPTSPAAARRSVTSSPRVATAGAAAREMLITAAAQTLNVPRSACVAANGAVSRDRQRREEVGHLRPGRRARRDRCRYRRARRSRIRRSTRSSGSRSRVSTCPSKVNGSAVYGLDVRVPGMVFAAIKHAPAFGATLATYAAGAGRALAWCRSPRCRVARRDHARATSTRLRSSRTTRGRRSKARAGSGPSWTIPPSVAQLELRPRSAPRPTRSWRPATAILGEPPTGDVDAALAAATHGRSTRPTTCRTSRTSAWRC